MRTDYDVLVVGGGFGGLHTARAIENDTSARRLRTLLVTTDTAFTFTPLLPEVAAGSIEPRHALAPLAELLPRTDIALGAVVDLDIHGTATLLDDHGLRSQVTFRSAVLAPGAEPSPPPFPDATNVFTFRTVRDAAGLRDHVLGQLDRAASTIDPDTRQRALTFVVIGGGSAGVEAIAELEGLARRAITHLRGVHHDDTRWILIDASDRLLPGVDRRLAGHAAARLAERGIDVYLGTRVSAASGGRLSLHGDHTEVIDTETVIWTAGQRSRRVISEWNLPSDDRGHITVDEHLRVHGTPAIFAVGDAAAVLQLGAADPKTAQHAQRQATVAAHNAVATLTGAAMHHYRYRTRGLAVTLGHGDGVCQVGRLRITGRVAWWMGRAYHLLMVPGSRRTRILADWCVELTAGMDTVHGTHRRHADDDSHDRSRSTSPTDADRDHRRIHLALGVTDVNRSVTDYTALLGRKPVVVIDDEYALWIDDHLNLSIRADDDVGLRHLGWQDPNADTFTIHHDSNGLTWERFTLKHQLDEIRTTWPHAAPGNGLGDVHL